MRPADRLTNIPPYHFARWGTDVRAVQVQGADVIRLDVGNPDMPPPDEIVEALCRSVHRPDQHGYPGYRGQLAFRQAIAKYYHRRFGVTLDPETQVLPLLGSKEGIIHVGTAFLDPGDLALVPDPGYAPYARSTLLADGQVYTVTLPAENGFLPDLAAIPGDVADRARLMWLNYPNNPTGATAGLEFLAQAVAFARRHDLLLCHDAPYTDVTYGDYTAPSLLEVDGALDVAIELNSLSKTFNMAGWRVGMAVGNPDGVAALAQVKSNVDSGIFRPIQDAAVAALAISPGWIAERNRIYRERLEIIVEGVKAAGMQASLPQATLYVWTRVPPGQTAGGFSAALLNRAGVAVASGTFFGPAGADYVRISATAPTERVEEAMERLVRFAG